MSEDFLDQTVIIQYGAGYETSLDFGNNHFLDDVFTQSYTGEGDTGVYRVVVGEDEFLKLYDFFTRILAYGRLGGEYVDDYDGLVELYEEMKEVIVGSYVSGVIMEYYLRYDEEDEVGAD